MTSVNIGQLEAAVTVAASATKKAQAALEAHKAELAAQELPEVWYILKDDNGDLRGWYYPKGEDGYAANTRFFCNGLEAIGDNIPRSSVVKKNGIESVAKAVHDNAHALMHGADFTGRLDQINVPVCELNQATRDEMLNMPCNAFEVLINGDWASIISHSGVLLNEFVGTRIDAIYRLRATKTRTMTRKEAALWCSWCEVEGVVYRAKGGACWWLITAWDYEDDPSEMEHAPIHTLNDDGTGGEWEAFEVAV